MNFVVIADKMTFLVDAKDSIGAIEIVLADFKKNRVDMIAQIQVYFVADDLTKKPEQ